jgi:type I restriction enzyme M protein
VLFIDARKLGRMVSRVHRELTDEEIARIAQTYHAWRGNAVGAHRDAPYRDIPGFCRSATLDEIRKHGYVLTPGRYVGAAEQEDDGEPFEEKIRRLVGATARPAGRGCQARRRHHRQPEGAGVLGGRRLMPE